MSVSGDQTLSALASCLRALAHHGQIDVRTDAETLAAYAKDEGDVAPQTPGAVIHVASTAEAAAVLAAANQHGIPVTARAGGSSRVGSATPVRGGLVLCCGGMTQVCDVDRENRIAVVEPGITLDALNRVLAADGLMYAPDPNSSAYCCIGGTIGTNAAGPRTFKYGATREHVLGLEVALADGRTLQLGRRTRKGVTGYDLVALFVGSEGTLGITGRATLRLLPRPGAIVSVMAYFDNIEALPAAVNALASGGVDPLCIEMMDAPALHILRDAGVAVPVAEAALLLDLEVSATAGSARLERAGAELTRLGASEVHVAESAPAREALWAVRRDLSRTLRECAVHKVSDDVVVPLTAMADLLAHTRALSERFSLCIPTYGHAGDGNLHVNFLWNDDAERPKVEAATRSLFEKVIALGGTLTGEHGLGLTKRDYLPLEQSADLIAIQRALKAVFDPRGILNPDKIFPQSHGPC